MYQHLMIQLFLIIELIQFIFMNIHYILGLIFTILFIKNIYILYYELNHMKYVNKLINKKPNKMRVNNLLD